MKIGILVCVSYFSCLPCLLTVAMVYLPFQRRRSQDSQTETQGTYEADSGQRGKLPDTLHVQKALSHLFLFDDTEVNRTYTYHFTDHLQTKTNSQVLLGMLAMHKQWIPGRLLSSHAAWE